MEPTLLISILIGIVYPWYIGLTYEKVNEKIKLNSAWRMVDYKKTIFIFWLLAFLVLGNHAFSDGSKVPLGLSFNPSIIAAIISILIIGIVVFLFTRLKVSRENAPAIREKMKGAYQYLPKNKRELRWFVFLSVSAGVCEELIFRGFLVGFLTQQVNSWIAVVAANLVFAFTHIGSGKQNLFSSFVLGLIFSGIYYFTGSLLPAILLHTAIDLYSGILGFKASKLEEEKLKVT